MEVKQVASFNKEVEGYQNLMSLNEDTDCLGCETRGSIIRGRCCTCGLEVDFD